jgi:hypothetical protein
MIENQIKRRERKMEEKAKNVMKGIKILLVEWR